MKQEEFDQILEDQIASMRKVLSSKAKEYADDSDRLHNFMIAADLNDCTTDQALWGFLTKHIVSLRDMVYNNEMLPMEMWEEKIGDTINYLILLKAVVIEQHKTQEALFPMVSSGDWGVRTLFHDVDTLGHNID